MDRGTWKLDQFLKMMGFLPELYQRQQVALTPLECSPGEKLLNGPLCLKATWNHLWATPPDATSLNKENGGLVSTLMWGKARRVQEYTTPQFSRRAAHFCAAFFILMVQISKFGFPPPSDRLAESLHFLVSFLHCCFICCSADICLPTWMAR